ncbi:hypothetical protein L226DRAFT_361931 [Lentinus tigrinus ALCF2SS1-7]|uniref:uncharacterized protein n=1 Tax=Lentinus tigrinus ALCF2SS1-7 TaxID=1328758 RepID=UPI0011662D56|nr:hypothetical protein L226DRAFT_361931 [Lentinus tigrinus ALCF2SS1-7]
MYNTSTTVDSRHGDAVGDSEAASTGNAGGPCCCCARAEEVKTKKKVERDINVVWLS